MAKFTDSAGNEWAIRLTVGNVAALKSEAGFDLSAACRGGEALARALYDEPDTFAKILWQLVSEQNTRLDLKPAGFLDLLDSETLDAASDAFLEAVADFFHRRRSGEVKRQLPALLATIDRTHAEAVQASVAALTSKREPTNSPESSE